MIRVAACALAALLLSGAAAGAPARTASPVDTLEQAIKKEQLAIQELKFRHGDAARVQLNESRVLLAGIKGVSAAAKEQLRHAEGFDELAIEWSQKKNGTTHARKLIEYALDAKQLALEAMPKAGGCVALAGESKKSPGETEITIRGCSQTVSAIELAWPVKVKSTSQAASVSSKITGGLATSNCVEPTPTTISCGGYPTFLPAGGTFLLDVLPHLKPGQKVTATVHGKTLTVTLTIVQH